MSLTSATPVRYRFRSAAAGGTYPTRFRQVPLKPAEGETQVTFYPRRRCGYRPSAGTALAAAVSPRPGGNTSCAARRRRRLSRAPTPSVSRRQAIADLWHSHRLLHPADRADFIVLELQLRDGGLQERRHRPTANCTTAFPTCGSAGSRINFRRQAPLRQRLGCLELAEGLRFHRVG